MQGQYAQSTASTSFDEEDEGGGVARQGVEGSAGRKRPRNDQEGPKEILKKHARNSPKPEGSVQRSRSRVHFSCTECHRRKQRCNREQPCQHCVARKIPERCRTFQPGEDPNDVMTRVNRLEESMNDKFDRIFALLQSQQQQHRRQASHHDYKDGHAHADSATAMTERKHSKDRSPSASSFPASRSDVRPTGVVAWRKNASSVADGSATGAVPIEQAEGSEAGDEVVLYNGGPDSSSTSFHAGNLTSRVNTLISDVKDNRSNKMADPLLLTDPMRNIEQSAQLDALMFEVGATYSISQVLLAALPPGNLCRALVEHFFDHNWLRQPLSRRYYMERFDAFWREGPTLTANNLNLYALYLLTASIGILTYRGPLQVSEDARVIRLTAKRLFFAARQGLLISTMLGREDVEQVVCFQLASRFLFIDRRVSEAWSCVASAVKTAHSIGLHRDGTMLGLPRHVCAARRRIWAVVYFTERILCMNLGRPTAIDDDVVDVEMIDDDDIEGEFEEFSQPVAGQTIPKGETPRFLTFTLIRQKLAKIMGQVIAIYQNVQMPAHYSDVVSVDNSLEALHDSFPDHLKSEFDHNGELRHFERSWDSVYPFVPVHRYLLQAELLFVRMSLHRPYLIRPSTSSTSEGSTARSPSTAKQHQRRDSNPQSSTSNSSGHHHHHHHHHHPHRYNFSRRSCIEAAYQTLMLRKDLSDMIKSQMGEGDLPPSWVAQIGTYNTLSAIVILSIYLLTEPKAENAEMMIKPLRIFYDLYQVKRRRTRDELREREFTILRMFLERIEEARASFNESSAVVRSQTGVKRSMKRKEKKKSQDDLLPIGESSLSSKEEDTAGALLDLNQNKDPALKEQKNDALSSTPLNPVVNAKDVASSTSHFEQGGLDKVNESTLPWPYLPLRTPHHTETSSSAKISSNPQQTQPQSTVTKDATDGKRSSFPLGASVDGSGNETGSASVHQLFDSWFRSNAFENVDIDTLNMGAEGIPFLSEQSTSTGTEGTFGLASRSGSSGLVDAPIASDAGGTYFGFGMPSAIHEGKALLPFAPSFTQHNPPGNAVQWSTVPAPSYATTANVTDAFDGQSAVLGQSYPGISSTNISDIQSPQQPHASGMSRVANAHPDSYDPTFWQSLIDKLAK